MSVQTKLELIQKILTVTLTVLETLSNLVNTLLDKIGVEG